MRIRTLGMLLAGTCLLSACGPADPPGSVNFVGKSGDSDQFSPPTPQVLVPVPGNSNHTTGNPFAGTVMYVNPDYVAEVSSSVALFARGSSDAVLAAKAKAFPTAVWFDRLGAVQGGAQNGNHLGLKAHLDAAADQAVKSGQQVSVLFVLFDLPNRLCSTTSEYNGTAGLADYKNKFIDLIYSTITSNTRYQNLHVIFVLEPGSLASLATNPNDPTCSMVAKNGLFSDGISYAAQRLGTLPNVYLYLDGAWAGWLGWPSNAAIAAKVYQPIMNANAGLLRGLAINSGNYVPMSEPYLDPNEAKALPFYGQNPSIDNATYVGILDKAFSNVGLGNLSFIVDTSRSGWATLNDGKPIDRRQLRSNGCNVAGVGIGPRPQVNPTVSGNLNIDAFVFLKSPGESDGASTDAGCSPTASGSDSLPNAPKALQWFHDGFMEMMRLATPAL